MNPEGKHILSKFLSVSIRLAVFLMLGFFVCAVADRVMFPSPHTGTKTGNLTLHSGEAELDAFWRPGPPGAPVILYSHGNNETLAWIRNLLEGYARRGYGILGYDYAGYGGSSGKADEKQACRDIDAAYRFLTEEKKIPPEQIVLVGFSIGCGPTCYAAEKYPVKAAVLCAPFASAFQVILPFPLPGDRFHNARRMSRTRVPLLLFHGKKDSIIPFRNGEKVYNMAAGDPKIFVPIEQAGHNDILDTLGETYWERLADFTGLKKAEI